MTTQRSKHSAIEMLNPPDVPVEQKRRVMTGQRLPADQTAFIDVSDLDSNGVVTETAMYQGELPAGAHDAFDLDQRDDLGFVAETYGDELPDEITDELTTLDDDADLLDQVYANELPDSLIEEMGDRPSLEFLTELELRAEETDDPTEAAEEGYTYVPPIDPPIVPGYPGTTADFEVASGLGLSALDEPYNEAHHSDFNFTEDEITARVREALRADSSTCLYANLIKIETDDGVVTLRGLVDDLIDVDNLLAVAAYVEGIIEVVDELRVRDWRARR